MATLDLSKYTNLGGQSQSVLGYSTNSAGTIDNGYSLFGTSKLYAKDYSATVALIIDGGSAHHVSLNTGEVGHEKEVTDLNVGSSSDAWSILGSSDKVSYIKTIKTGAGNDNVEMAAMADGANINTGAGNDSVSIVSALGSMTLELGDGNDSVQVSVASGALTVNAGSGKNEVSIGKADSTFTYNGGEDADIVSLNSVGKSAELHLGNGANVASVGTAESDLTIESGDGVDSISVAKVEGTAVINAGDGNNFVSVSVASGTLTVTGGSGKDSISIGSVGKDATIALGDGADTVKIADKVEGLLTINADGEAANLVSVHSGTIDKGVAINMASGNDTVVFDNSGLTIGGTISLGDGKDEVSIASAIEKATITGGSGNKVVSLGDKVTEGSITLGNGKDTVSITGKVEDSTIDLGDGRDVLLFTKSVIGSTINLGAENDIVSIGAGSSNKVESTTINLGDGNDTISLGNAKMSDVTISGGAGKDVFSVGGAFDGTVTISDFEVGTDTLYAGATTQSQLDFTSDGQVSIGSGAGKAKVQMAATNGYYATTVEIGGEAFNVAWAGESATTIDVSSFNKAAILVGNDNDGASDTLLGGTKNDTIYAGANDFVYGGAGNDSIVVDSSSDVTYVGFSKNGGKDSISGGFATDDVVYLFENAVTDIDKITVSGGNTTLKMGTATMTLAQQKFVLRDSSGSDYKTTVVTSGTNVDSIEAMADIYYAADGKKGSLNFSKFNDKLVVDLGNTGIVTNTNNAQYLGKYESLKGGSDDTILMGAAGQSESLEAGTGATTIWGGGSKSDVMIHNGSDNSVMFVFGQGDGKDSVVSSNWGGSDTNDVLWLNSGSISSVKYDGTDTTVALSSGDKVYLRGRSDANTILKYTTDGGNTISKAKIGKSGQANNFTYVEDVTAYIGGTGNTLTVGSDVDTANIWLDGSQGKSYESVKVVDAHTSSGDIVIAGLGDNNESLVAAKGSSSLWGGAGSSNDTLSGTTGGTTTYFWGNGDGKDVITGSHSDDLVNLYNVALSDIADLKTTSTSMEVTLNDGSVLTINNMSSSSVKTFKLSDGSTWEYSTSTKSWTQA